MSTTLAAASKPKEELATFSPLRLPYHPVVQERFGVDKSGWKVLIDVVFSAATSSDTVILALSYCKARNLDPMKRNVHIVPVYNKAQKKMVDTIWPGIGELRTTAFRTREYAGRGATIFGPDVTESLGGTEVTYPEWAQVTVKRLVGGVPMDFAGPKVFWLETYSTMGRDTAAPNEMWRERSRGQLDKCAEAAALRCAFPEEIGGDYAAEEVRQFSPTVTIEAEPAVRAPQTLLGLTQEGEQGEQEEGEQEQGEQEEGEQEEGEVSPDEPAKKPLTYKAAMSLIGKATGMKTLDEIQEQAKASVHTWGAGEDPTFDQALENKRAELGGRK